MSSSAARTPQSCFVTVFLYQFSVAISMCSMIKYSKLASANPAITESMLTSRFSEKFQKNRIMSERRRRFCAQSPVSKRW